MFEHTGSTCMFGVLRFHGWHLWLEHPEMCNKPLRHDFFFFLSDVVSSAKERTWVLQRRKVYKGLCTIKLCLVTNTEHLNIFSHLDGLSIFYRLSRKDQFHKSFNVPDCYRGKCVGGDNSICVQFKYTVNKVAWLLHTSADLFYSQLIKILTLTFKY